MSDRRDVRDALQAYVRGHDRVWERRAKFEDCPRASETEIEFGKLPAQPRFGVAVPRLLEFQRGPAIWRDHSANTRNSSDD